MAALAGSGYWIRGRAVKPAPARYRTAKARTGAVERTLRVSGVISAARSATMVAPKLRGARGRSFMSSEFRLLLRDVVKPGEPVKKGDAVAAFDPQYMVNRVDEFKADVEQRKMTNRRIDASTELARARLEQRIRVARANIEKAALNLKTAPVRSAMQTERFQLAYEEAGARLENLLVQRKFFDLSERSQLRREELALKDSNLELERAEANLDRMNYRSPLDGVAVMGQIQRGSDTAEIQTGDEVRSGHAFMQVVDMKSLFLDARALQVDEQRLRPGLEARIHLDAVPGLEIPGRVVAVGAIATANRYRPDWVRNLVVQVRPDHADPRVFPNFTGSADLVLGAEEGVVLPRECVDADTGTALFRGESGDGEETWSPRLVELGTSNNIEVVVREGITPGEVVACGAAANH